DRLHAQVVQPGGPGDDAPAPLGLQPGQPLQPGQNVPHRGRLHRAEQGWPPGGPLSQSTRNTNKKRFSATAGGEPSGWCVASESSFLLRAAAAAAAVTTVVVAVLFALVEGVEVLGHVILGLLAGRARLVAGLVWAAAVGIGKAVVTAAG